MDATFFQGMAAFVSALLIFCGSVWLLLAMIMGGRLAYFITASVTLGFVLIMAVVWSINPLGPVGELPEWNPVDVGDSPDQLEFGPAAEYPGDPWRPPNEADDAELAKAGELETDAVDVLEQAIEEGETDAFEDAGDAVIADDATRLLEQGDDEYGMVTFEPLEGVEGDEAVVVMRYDPGNPLGPARQIAVGTAALFILHLFALGRSERKARRRAADEEEGVTTT